MKGNIFTKHAPSKLAAIICCSYLLLSFHTAQAEPRYQTAENVDCRLLLDSAYFVEWEGNCSVGKAQGRGVAYYFDENRTHTLTYKGRMERGDFHGQGEFIVMSSGSRYDGQWQRGKRHGEGESYVSGKYTYKGSWRNNKRHGYGEWIHASGDQRYVGEWENGKKHGRGKTEWSSGATYVGWYSDGKRHGRGAYTNSSGEMSAREYRYGERTY